MEDLFVVSPKLENQFGVNTNLEDSVRVKRKLATNFKLPEDNGLIWSYVKVKICNQQKVRTNLELIDGFRHDLEFIESWRTNFGVN